jgi:hypothetical protein
MLSITSSVIITVVAYGAPPNQTASQRAWRCDEKHLMLISGYYVFRILLRDDFLTLDSGFRVEDLTIFQCTSPFESLSNSAQVREQRLVIHKLHCTG